MPSQDLLNKYADVAIRVGIALAPGDRLLIVSSVEAVEFTRALVERAYSAGAATVDVLWGDDAVGRARFSHGSAEATETVSTTTHFRLASFAAGDAALYVEARDPDALAGLDPARISAFERINRQMLMPIAVAQGTLDRPWSVVAAPTPAWAKKVFPDSAVDEAVELLWGAIFRACRIDSSDPVAEWQAHVEELAARSRHLSQRTYRALRYEAPGTDLRLGLPAGALWVGGSAGSRFVPNLPTEEVFTSPHRLVGTGHVTATKPLSLYGNLVEGFAFEVAEGRIVAATASSGQNILDELLATDDGSVRFGEAAMVPMSSAVAAEKLIWNNTLYDENDGCHIAVGRAYPITVEGGTDMTEDQLLAAGLNMSSTHVDFVVGSDRLNVYGELRDGAEEPVIIAGEWGFEA